MTSVILRKARTAYRLAVSNALRYSLRLLPSNSAHAKPLLPLTYLTMCSISSLDCLVNSLHPLDIHWTHTPAVRIISDGTLSVKSIQRKLKWWKGPLSVETFDTVTYHHKSRDRGDLVKFANRHIFGKKLAAIIAASEESPTLWCDTDYLWFQEPEELVTLATMQHSICYMKVCEDSCACYDQAMVEIAGLHFLYSRPYINAGCIFASGNLLDLPYVRDLIRIAANQENDYFNWSTEQTIIAAAARSSGCPIWTRDEIALFSNEFSLLVRYRGHSWHARHYPTPSRSMFWRDAWAVRLGLTNIMLGGK